MFLLHSRRLKNQDLKGWIPRPSYYYLFKSFMSNVCTCMLSYFDVYLKEKDYLLNYIVSRFDIFKKRKDFLLLQWLYYSLPLLVWCKIKKFLLQERVSTLQNWCQTQTLTQPPSMEMNRCKYLRCLSLKLTRLSQAYGMTCKNGD